MFGAVYSPTKTAVNGYAIGFRIYRTFQRRAPFIEEVYVRLQFRDKEIGKAMIGESCGDSVPAPKAHGTSC